METHRQARRKNKEFGENTILAQIQTSKRHLACQEFRLILYGKH